ncbi:hypothetical protein HDU79_002672 [Rhizoclosmatium sp. JEL0117]|nr:hypothetical protein HDU79_002672 [Rhizoclosmatium sp. JEL0117]
MTLEVQLARIKQTLSPLLAVIALPIAIVLNLIAVLITWRSVPRFNARGKVIVITGASSGIGEALALRYAADGAKLVLCVGTLQDVKCQVLDVTNESQLKSLLDSTGSQYGCIDVLILNAGIAMNQLVETSQDVSVFRRVMELNYFAVLSGIIFAMPHLKASSRGKIVVIASELGIYSAPLLSGYNASKFALRGFFDGFRMEEPGFDDVSSEMDPYLLCPEHMSTQTAAELIVDAVKVGKRDVTMTVQGGVLWYIISWVPVLREVITCNRFAPLLRAAHQKKRQF